MKKVIYIFLLLSYGLWSCNKNVLDKKPLDIISDAVVWSDPALIDAYLAQAYSQMNFINDMQFGADRNWFALTTQTNIADECSAGWEWIDGGRSYQISSTATFGEWWGYSQIRTLNIFIEKMPESPIEADLKAKRIAEARFLRAFSYFNMVKRYGGIPLITGAQPIDLPEEELYSKRDKEEDVYNFIVSELDAIINDLEDKNLDDGRPTRYAALALKSRAAMYAASIAKWGALQLDGIVGIPVEKAQQFWQTSYDASQLIISSKKFGLYNKTPDDKASNFRNIFLDENNQEVIFSEIYNGAAGKNHSWDMMNNPFGFSSWGTGGQSCAYLEMIEEFENVDGSPGVIDRQKIEDGHLWTVEELFGNKDPRFKASILTQGSEWMGNNLQVYKGIIREDGTITEGGYKDLTGWGLSTTTRGGGTPFMILKYLDESEAIVPGMGTSKTDWIVFRYAEILLNFAEAAFELGKTDEALDAINEIRERAGIKLLSAIDRDKIRHERKVELAFEGNRYWDVRRWRTAEHDLSLSLSSMKFIIDYTTRKFKLEIIKNFAGLPTPKFYPRHYYLPITLSRINNNPNLVENPGYE